MMFLRHETFFPANLSPSRTGPARVIAGASFAFWLWFHLAVLAVLLVDAFGLQRGGRVSLAVSLLWTLFLVALSLGFDGYLFGSAGTRSGLEFLSGYTIELSLSVDNLFVFLLLFESFGLSPAEQRRALGWGVAGALLMRGAFIAAGVALLRRFGWVEYVFGVLLLVAAVRLMLQKPGRHAQPRWTRWFSKQNRRAVPIFLLAVCAIELTDMVFAFDSVPAVIAVSRQPFIIYTSNLCAILGLRSLYFVLAEMLYKLRLLHYGLGLVLAFVGLKMLLGRWVQVPTGWSLVVILGMVALFTGLSLTGSGSRRATDPGSAASGPDRR